LGGAEAEAIGGEIRTPIIKVNKTALLPHVFFIFISLHLHFIINLFYLKNLRKENLRIGFEDIRADEAPDATVLPLAPCLALYEFELLPLEGKKKPNIPPNGVAKAAFHIPSLAIPNKEPIFSITKGAIKNIPAKITIAIKSHPYQGMPPLELPLEMVICGCA